MLCCLPGTDQQKGGRPIKLLASMAALCLMMLIIECKFVAAIPSYRLTACRNHTATVMDTSAGQNAIELRQVQHVMANGSQANGLV